MDFDGEAAHRVYQRRERDDAVALELEGVEREGLARRDGEVAKRGRLGVGVLDLLRPAERGQQRIGEEDAATRPLGPVCFDEADEVQVIELTEARGDRVEEVDALDAVVGRERLRLERVVDERGQLVGVARGVVVARERVGDLVEGAEDRGARAAPAGSRGVRRRFPEV